MADSDNKSHIEGSQTQQLWWNLHSNTTVLALVLLVGLCVIAAFVFKPLLQPAQSNLLPEASAFSQQLQVSQGITTEAPIYFSWAGNGNNNDIYALNPSGPTTQAINLTHSDKQSEYWPVPCPIDQRLAFFSVSATGDRILYVFEPDGGEKNVIYDTGVSGLDKDYQIDLDISPQWSTDGHWIAFLGQATDGGSVIELFVADTRASKVYRLTKGGNVVVAMRWLGKQEIFYAQRGQENSLVPYRISVAGLTTETNAIAVPYQAIEPNK